MEFVGVRVLVRPPKMAQNRPKNFFCPILTKLGVHIVRIMVILNIKKKFEIFHFSDHFLSENKFRTPQNE